ATAMSAGHIQQRYGDFRYSAALHDADPDRPGNILLAYNRQSVSATWNSGSTWNREHVWPQSRQPGSASNSTRGNLGDPHALRPCNPTVNGQRSNKPFGLSTTVGSFRSLGSYWFAGDRDKGDIARSIFYSSVRYNLPLSDGFPSSNQMGELGSMVAHHYADVPDEFERRRNHVIYSQSENPSYYTNNRSAFVDLPWAVWSVFVDDQNDSRLYVGSGPGADGGSSVAIHRRAIEGAAVAPESVTLHRDGSDGVYYAVRSSGDITSDQPLAGGFTGAFAIGDSSPRSISIGVDAGVISGPGRYSGRVVIDNLDLTTGLGSGFGGLDGDDVIDYELDVLSPSGGSFDPVSVV
ncbi:MAG: endonuclease, partial [Planctomycetota bacterium]